MKYSVSRLKALNALLIEKTLRHDETIACTNATVVIDKEGNVTSWYDNNASVCFIHEE